jgi:hypothetical protein
MENVSPVNVNYFGGIPLNWDDKLGFKTPSFGPGTDRPIGFVFNQMHFLYWNIRYFKYAINGFIQKDQFSSFISAGGATGGTIGASAGLIAASGGQTSFNSSGKTSISYLSRRVNRIRDNKLAYQTKKLDDYSLAAEPNTPAAKQVIHYNRPNFKDKKIDGKNVRVPLGVNEGSIVSGVIHSSSSNNVLIYIDFSSIVFYKNLYYPIIMIQTPLGSSFLRSTSISVDGKTTYNLSPGLISSPFAYVTFYSGGLIPMYVFQADVFSQVFISGVINIPSTKECCSRFYYDGHDKERAELAKEDGCSECEKLGVGEKTNY